MSAIRQEEEEEETRSSYLQIEQKQEVKPIMSANETEEEEDEDEDEDEEEEEAADRRNRRNGRFFFCSLLYTRCETPIFLFFCRRWPLCTASSLSEAHACSSSIAAEPAQQCH